MSVSNVMVSHPIVVKTFHSKPQMLPAGCARNHQCQYNLSFGDHDCLSRIHQTVFDMFQAGSRRWTDYTTLLTLAKNRNIPFLGKIPSYSRSIKLKFKTTGLTTSSKYHHLHNPPVLFICMTKKLKIAASGKKCGVNEWSLGLNKLSQ